MTIQDAKNNAKKTLGKIPGVVGFGVGEASIRVYVASPLTAIAIPKIADGYPIEIVVAGQIVPQDMEKPE